LARARSRHYRSSSHRWSVRDCCRKRSPCLARRRERQAGIAALQGRALSSTYMVASSLARARCHRLSRPPFHRIDHIKHKPCRHKDHLCSLSCNNHSCHYLAHMCRKGHIQRPMSGDCRDTSSLTRAHCLRCRSSIHRWSVRDCCRKRSPRQARRRERLAGMALSLALGTSLAWRCHRYRSSSHRWSACDRCRKRNPRLARRRVRLAGMASSLAWGTSLAWNCHR